MNPSKNPTSLDEWKNQIKATWNEKRKQVIFQGNGGIIYPTTPSTEPSTHHTTTTITVNLTTHGTDLMTTISNSFTYINVGGSEQDRGLDMADTEGLIKIIGITIASLLAIIILALIIIHVCRRRKKNKNKRISLRRPLHGEDPDHIYAEIEPLRANDKESPSTSSGAVPLPTKKHKRKLGVSSIRYVSVRLGRLFGSGSRHSSANDAIFFSKESESVRTRTLPSGPDFRNLDHKGKRHAPRQKLPSSSRPLLDGESQISSSSADVLVEMREREHVYNPLTRQADSGPYDHLKLGKTGTGMHITDEGAPESPHDYFVLEKENGAHPQNGDKKNNLYFILEKEEDRLDKDLSPNPTELESMQEENHNTKLAALNSIGPKEKCESKKVHDYFVLEAIVGSSGSEENAGKPLLESSPPLYQTNTESSRISYELAKNIPDLGESQSHSDDKSSSIPSSPGHKMQTEISQKSGIPNYVCLEATENSKKIYDEPSIENICVQNGLEGDHGVKNKDFNRKKTAGSDDYMEPVKLKTHSEYLEINPFVPKRTTSKQQS